MSDSLTKPRVLFVDDDRDILTSFKFTFKKYYEVCIAASAAEALKILEEIKINAIVSDQKMPAMTGVEFLEIVHEKYETIPSIILTAYVDITTLTEGINRAKVFGYLHKPYNEIDLRSLIDNAIEFNRLMEHNNQLIQSLSENNRELMNKTMELESEIERRKLTELKLLAAFEEIKKLKEELSVENIYLREEISSTKGFENIIAKSPRFLKVLELVDYVSKSDTTVLITGETGTGKELIARAIHKLSDRAGKSLVTINCAALPPNIIESELFGHEKGSFTGAISRKIGRFELANKGTIFLDEIGELPMELQVKLLRVLQEGEIQRVGSNDTMKVDVRIISATNKDLNKLYRENKFREDLFYRLNVFPINLIPLRERKEDIPILIKHFVKKYAAKQGKNITQVSENIMNALQEYHWPGNIRELENIIERSVILTKSEKLNVDLSFVKFANQSQHENQHVDDNSEKSRLVEILKKCDWKVEGKNGAASLLNIPPSTIRYRMKIYSINRPTRI